MTTRENHTSFEAIADELGKLVPGFELAPNRYDNPNFALFVRGDGAALRVYLNTYRGKFEISGQWPKDPEGNLMSAREWRVIPYNAVEPGIKCSSTRKPEGIAKDIVRRFLPDYLELYAKVLERQAKREAHKQNREALTKELCQILRGELHNDKKGARRYYKRSGDSVYIQVHSGESVTLELRVGPEEARKVLQVLENLLK